MNAEDTSHLLQNLEPDTLYDVSVTAIYPDESESEDLIGNQRTCKKISFFGGEANYYYYSFVETCVALFQYMTNSVVILVKKKKDDIKMTTCEF